MQRVQGIAIAALIAAWLGVVFACTAEAGPRRWELGLGAHGGWAHLEEAAPDGFALSEEPGYGVLLGAGYRLTPRAAATLSVFGGRQDANQASVRAEWSAALIGLRYELALAGGLAPFLRGGLGAVHVRIREDGRPAGGTGGRPRREQLELDGLAGLIGAGMRLAVSPRLQLDLELDHLIVGYNDDSVVLESGYTGTRIDKAGSFTRLALVARLLL